MTTLRRFWFPASVLLLLAVIAINLYALGARRSRNVMEEKQEGPQHAQVTADAKNVPASRKEHGHELQVKEPQRAEELGQPHDQPMMDHKGMMGHGMMGKGMMHKGMMGMMHGNMADMMEIRFLLANNEKIKRTVKRLPDGVETVTTSNDKAVADKIRTHVKAMYERLQKKQPIRPMDPLFAAIFENANKIELSMTTLPDGLQVRETSKDPYAVKLIHAHADVVDRFVRQGMSAMMSMTPAPKRD